MNAFYPVYTIVPGKTRVSEAVRMAHAAGADLWRTGRGKIVLAPIGRPGWRRLNIRVAEAA